MTQNEAESTQLRSRTDHPDRQIFIGSGVPQKRRKFVSDELDSCYANLDKILMDGEKRAPSSSNSAVLAFSQKDKKSSAYCIPVLAKF